MDLNEIIEENDWESQQDDCSNYGCYFCYTHFNKISDLESHLGQTIGETLFCCSLCENFFDEYSMLENHKKIMHEGNHEKTIFKCICCNAKFTSINQQQLHYSSYHLMPAEWQHFCTVCGECFPTNCKLKCHLYTDHSSIECSACNRNFSSFETFQAHMKKIKCIKCKMLFCCNFTCQRHLMEEKNIPEAPRKNHKKITQMRPLKIDQVYSLKSLEEIQELTEMSVEAQETEEIQELTEIPVKAQETIVDTVPVPRSLLKVKVTYPKQKRRKKVTTVIRKSKRRKILAEIETCITPSVDSKAEDGQDEIDETSEDPLNIKTENEVAEEPVEPVEDIPAETPPEPKPKPKPKPQVPDRSTRFTKKVELCCEFCENFKCSSDEEKASHMLVVHNLILKRSTSASQNGIISNTYIEVVRCKLPYACLNCDSRFADLESLQKHINTPLNAEIFFCRECSEFFQTEVLYENHLATSHNKKFLCKTCLEKFLSYEMLDAHVSTMHRKPKSKKLKCTKCPTRFLTKAELECHQMSVRECKPLYMQKFQCPQCDLSFQHIHQVIRHQLIENHLSEFENNGLLKAKHPRHECDVCEEECFPNGMLKLHKNLNHSKMENK